MAVTPPPRAPLCDPCVGLYVSPFFFSSAKRIQNKAVVNETRSVEELSALLAKAESAFDMQQVFHYFKKSMFSGLYVLSGLCVP